MHGRVEQCFSESFPAEWAVMTNIYIIRHGQTNMNRKHVVQGRIDEPLNEVGISQAEEARDLLRSRHIVFDQVFSSPLERAFKTAQIVAGEDVPVMTDDRLLEMECGPYEGADLNNPPLEIILFFLDIAHADVPEGVEPPDSIVRRVGEFLEAHRKDFADGNILISTHALAMKAALNYLSPDSNGSFWNKSIGNCAIYVTSLKDGSFTIPVPLTADVPETEAT